MEDLKIWLILAQLINFTVLFLIFKYFLWDRLVKSIRERKKKLKDISEIEAKIKEKLEKAKKKEDKIIEDAVKRSNDIIAEAEFIAKNKRNKLLKEAEEESKSIINSGRSEIEKEKLSMLSEVKSNIVDLVLRFNKKLFWSEKVSSEFVEKEIELMK